MIIFNRLCRPWGFTREVISWQRTRRLGPWHPPLYARVQRKPILQHRRNHGPGASDPMGHEWGFHRSHQGNVGSRCRSAADHHPSHGAPLVQDGLSELTSFRIVNLSRVIWWFDQSWERSKQTVFDNEGGTSSTMLKDWLHSTIATASFHRAEFCAADSDVTTYSWLGPHHLSTSPK